MVGFVTSVDRGRYTTVVREGADDEQIVTCTRARELRNDAIVAAQKALNAAMEAVRSADYADRQAQYAREAGERVLHEMDDAKGDFDTLDRQVMEQLSAAAL